MNTLLIDNYDSFTYNVAQYLGELGAASILVRRNDALNLSQVQTINPERIVLSPGPCTPNEAGISMDLALAFQGKTPILGICLGHQAIGQALGGKVIRARQVMHGKSSQIWHDGMGVFQGLPNPFPAARYHSLILDWDSLPAALQVSAWTLGKDGRPEEIMGVRGASGMLEGIQFHPESILTKDGHSLLANFLNLQRTKKNNEKRGET